jgi:hypothetical protein
VLFLKPFDWQYCSNLRNSSLGNSTVIFLFCFAVARPLAQFTQKCALVNTLTHIFVAKDAYPLRFPIAVSQAGPKGVRFPGFASAPSTKESRTGRLLNVLAGNGLPDFVG